MVVNKVFATYIIKVKHIFSPCGLTFFDNLMGDINTIGSLGGH
jgi:hypothetical protein